MGSTTPNENDTNNSNSDNNRKAMIDNAFDIHDRATTASRIGRVRQTIVFPQQQQDNINGDDEQQQRSSSSQQPPLLVSEVDLEVGILPGLPFRVKGTVLTKAYVTNIQSDTFELQILSTTITNSNIPLLNQLFGNDSITNDILSSTTTKNNIDNDISSNTNDISQGINSLINTFSSLVQPKSNNNNDGGGGGRTTTTGAGGTWNVDTIVSLFPSRWDRWNEVPVGAWYKVFLGAVPKVPNKTYYLDESMRITRDQDDNFFIFTRA
jgi:hypothetical protein